MWMYTCSAGDHEGQKRVPDSLNWTFTSCELPTMRATAGLGSSGGAVCKLATEPFSLAFLLVFLREC